MEEAAKVSPDNANVKKMIPRSRILQNSPSNVARETPNLNMREQMEKDPLAIAMARQRDTVVSRVDTKRETNVREKDVNEQ